MLMCIFCCVSGKIDVTGYKIAITRIHKRALRHFDAGAHKHFESIEIEQQKNSSEGAKGGQETKRNGKNKY